MELPVRDEPLVERVAERRPMVERLVGWPNAAELALGRDLLEALRGRCDLVVHGHRHAASALVLASSVDRPLHVLNAGSTPELGRVRVVAHAAGRIVSERWLEVTRRSPWGRPGASSAATGRRAVPAAA